MLKYEEELYTKYPIIAGTDEAGRGPLAGPLVVAAVILKPDFNSLLINDSKKLSEKKRIEAYKLIIENAIEYTIKIIPIEIIDEINIYQASKSGMISCFNSFKTKIDLYITDAMPITDLKSEVISLIHGDSLSKNIAAASILAKVTRDNLMYELDKAYPQYDFAHNKGYGTKKHLEAIKQFGFIKGVHRLSYEPIKSLNKIN
ncbi:MAG: ribonuclease HII [Bacilli bacterium]